VAGPGRLRRSRAPLHLKPARPCPGRSVFANGAGAGRGSGARRRSPLPLPVLHSCGRFPRCRSRSPPEIEDISGSLRSRSPHPRSAPQKQLLIIYHSPLSVTTM